MFDKKKFLEENQRVQERQIKELAEYLEKYIEKNAHIRDLKIFDTPDQEKIDFVNNIPISDYGRDPKEVAEELIKNVYETSMLIQHPRFFSFVTSAVSPYSLTASVLNDIYNLNCAGWNLAPAANLIEEKIIKWMASLAGFDTNKCGGLFVSGGSMANMTGLIAARTDKLKETEYPIGVAYISDQTHSSVAKGLRLIGFRKDQVIVIPSDDDFKMRLDLLEEHIKEDINKGLKPFLVVGSMGTTNTGSIDPLNEIGNICEKYNMWFHVDGAYGGSILVSDIYRNYAFGIQKADSFSWDTHKWSMQVYSCSSVIAKDKQKLLNAFTEHPEYLADAMDQEHSDPWDLGPEMSRPARALKLWFTLQSMGTLKLADVIDYAFYNAILVEKKLKELSNWEICSKPMCGAINFRYHPDGLSNEELDNLNAEISRRINEDGFAYIVTTTIKGKRVLRMCCLNANTTDEDVLETVEYLDKIAKDIYK